MADFPFPWCVYAEHQTQAARCDRLTDRSWGTENGLNSLLKAVESGSVSQDHKEFQTKIERATATGSWLERNHARLLRKYVRLEENDAEQRLLDRICVREMQNHVNPAEWTLLMAITAGVAYCEIAGMSSGAARTRIARLRARLRSTTRREGTSAPESRQI